MFKLPIEGEFVLERLRDFRNNWHETKAFASIEDPLEFAAKVSEHITPCRVLLDLESQECVVVYQAF